MQNRRGSCKVVLFGSIHHWRREKHEPTQRGAGGVLQGRLGWWTDAWLTSGNRTDHVCVLHSLPCQRVCDGRLITDCCERVIYPRDGRHGHARGQISHFDAHSNVSVHVSLVLLIFLPRRRHWQAPHSRRHRAMPTHLINQPCRWSRQRRHVAANCGRRSSGRPHSVFGPLRSYI